MLAHPQFPERLHPMKASETEVLGHVRRRICMWGFVTPNTPCQLGNTDLRSGVTGLTFSRGWTKAAASLVISDSDSPTGMRAPPQCPSVSLHVQRPAPRGRHSDIHSGFCPSTPALPLTACSPAAIPELLPRRPAADDPEIDLLPAAFSGGGSARPRTLLSASPPRDPTAARVEKNASGSGQPGAQRHEPQQRSSAQPEPSRTPSHAQPPPQTLGRPAPKAHFGPRPFLPVVDFSFL